MQKCPKCGYSDGADWPAMLLIAAFILVDVVAWMSGVPKAVRLALSGGTLLLVASFWWRALRETRNRVEYLKSHRIAAEPPKNR